MQLFDPPIVGTHPPVCMHSLSNSLLDCPFNSLLFYPDLFVDCYNGGKCTYCQNNVNDDWLVFLHTHHSCSSGYEDTNILINGGVQPTRPFPDNIRGVVLYINVKQNVALTAVMCMCKHCKQRHLLPETVLAKKAQAKEMFMQLLTSLTSKICMAHREHDCPAKQRSVV